MDNSEILEKVAYALNMAEAEVLSKSRKTDIVDAKTIIAYKVHTTNKTKLHIIYDLIYHEQIRKPETRHCNVSNLLRRYNKLSQYDKSFQLKIEACRLI
jgi:flagellar biosynthesis/type III secretory pathway chaperone